MGSEVLLVTGAEELVIGPAAGSHPGGDGPPADPNEVLEIVADGAVALADGTVAAAGATEEVTAEYPAGVVDRRIDARGRAVIPGLIDSHTHAAFAGDRSDEFAEKLRGTAYQEILAAGGGILRTVRAVREASDSALLDRLLVHLDAMVATGSTTIEVKSGYGLDTETELRLLDAIRRADERHPARLIPTFMGAHAVPEGIDTPAYVREVVDQQLPAVAEQGVARFCDVFCEEGVFDVDQSRTVLEAGRDHGLTPKIHADEFGRLGGAELAAELGAASADHLLHSTPDDAAALAAAGVTPTFLPGTAFALDAAYADPRPSLAAGSEVAVATDFNPNCHAPGMNFTITLACVGMKLSPAEALRAATVGAAEGLATDAGTPEAVPPKTGTLQPGAPGDLVVLDAPSRDHLPYRFGENLADLVVIDGDVVVDRTTR